MNWRTSQTKGEHAVERRNQARLLPQAKMNHRRRGLGNWEQVEGQQPKKRGAHEMAAVLKDSQRWPQPWVELRWDQAFFFPWSIKLKSSASHHFPGGSISRQADSSTLGPEYSSGLGIINRERAKNQMIGRVRDDKNAGANDARGL